MLNDAAEALKTRVRADLLRAMRSREPVETSVLRALVAAMDNAQAVPAGEAHHRYVELRFEDRSAEAPRLSLSAGDVNALLHREIRERLQAAVEFDRHGRTERAAVLRAETDILARYLLPDV